jgi:hypothetical protein
MNIVYYINNRSLYSVMYNIYRLIHGHFHIGLVIILRPPYWPWTESRINDIHNMSVTKYLPLLFKMVVGCSIVSAKCSCSSILISCKYIYIYTILKTNPQTNNHKRKFSYYHRTIYRLVNS